jgi:hypothetical protein
MCNTGREKVRERLKKKERGEWREMGGEGRERERYLTIEGERLSNRRKEGQREGGRVW